MQFGSPLMLDKHWFGNKGLLFKNEYLNIKKYIFMIYAFDTYYQNGQAKTVCAGFQNWGDEHLAVTYEQTVIISSDYESGSFYKRELPCILQLLKNFALHKNDLIIVDGYVLLSDEGKLGLRGYLYNDLGHKIPVIGVAKNLFAGLNKNMRAVTRGKSKKPLYVTALGIDLDMVSEKIKNMHGEFRIPTLLKKVDLLTRK